MTRSLLIGIAALALSAQAFAKGGGAEWDAKSAADLKTIVEKFNADFVKGDMTAVKAAISDDVWGAWDLDMAMKAGSWANKAELNKFFDEMTGMMKKMGGSMGWKTTKLDCKVSGSLGVCFVEGDQTMNMPKMPPMTVAMRNTEVFAKEKGGWKIVHHHGSVAKEPPMPPKSIATNAKATAGWMVLGPDMPGAKLLPLWMNPANMSSSGLMKVTQQIKQPRHFHPYSMTFSVLEGSIVTSDAAGKDVEYGPGSVIYRAAGEVHQTTLKAGAVMFVVMTGPMATVYVDESGKPIQK